MTVKVLRSPSEFVAYCHNCTAVLSFEETDVQEELNLDTGEFKVIDCPCCKDQVSIPDERTTISEWKDSELKTIRKLKGF
jgi:hypothetical protein